MAAGLGFKTFTTGEVLTAADTNGYLMQGINVFASTAARDAAITSPQEGQFAYTKDTNSLWYYTGSAWAASGATGDIEGVTAGVGITGGGTSGTVTITNDMATTITASGDIVVGTGSGTYDNLPIGTTNQVLTADTTVSPYKVKWATPSAAANFVGVYAQTTTNQSIANATYTTMNIGGTDVFDTDSFHDSTTNNSRITIPSGKAGYYLIIGAIAWRDNGTGERQASLKLNGTIITYQPIFSSGNAGGGNFTTNLVVYIANLAVSDYIEIQGRQYSGGSLGIDFVQLTAQYLGA
jgi:hypothetical protein